MVRCSGLVVSLCAYPPYVFSGDRGGRGGDGRRWWAVMLDGRDSGRGRETMECAIAGKARFARKGSFFIVVVSAVLFHARST